MIHSGYSKTAIKEKSKIERNINLLRTELENDPDNINIKAYLADSLKLSDDESDNIEAEKLLWEVINSEEAIIRKLKIKSYMSLINKYIDIDDEINHSEELCLKALNEFPGNIDFEYYYASVFIKKGAYKIAWDILKKVEEKLFAGADIGSASYVPADSKLLNGQLLLSAQGLGDTDNVIVYARELLLSDKTDQSILCPYISILHSKGFSEEEILSRLGEIFDITNPNDLLVIARAAKDCGAVNFARMIMIIAGDLIINEKSGG